MPLFIALLPPILRFLPFHSASIFFYPTHETIIDLWVSPIPILQTLEFLYQHNGFFSSVFRRALVLQTLPEAVLCLGTLGRAQEIQAERKQRGPHSLQVLWPRFPYLGRRDEAHAGGKSIGTGLHFSEHLNTKSLLTSKTGASS